MKRILFLLILLFLTACTQQIIITEIEPASDFCGSSTEASCIIDSDCIQAGCSGQICQSSSEEAAISTCEYQDCYNAQDYGLSCACIEQKCSWG